MWQVRVRCVVCVLPFFYRTAANGIKTLHTKSAPHRTAPNDYQTLESAPHSTFGLCKQESPRRTRFHTVKILAIRWYTHFLGSCPLYSGAVFASSTVQTLLCCCPPECYEFRRSHPCPCCYCCRDCCCCCDKEKHMQPNTWGSGLRTIRCTAGNFVCFQAALNMPLLQYYYCYYC